MRLNEIAAREDLWGVLAKTLEHGWSEQFGHAIRVRREPTEAGQVWVAQALLSALAERPSRGARRFLADGFRFTPSGTRWPAQWLLGTLLASRTGLSLTCKPVLWVAPPIPYAENLIIVPGNRRVRVFDLGRGQCRVFLKDGFCPEPMRREVAVRGSGRDGPFIPIGARDEGLRWFEERIVTGYALPRAPPWWPRSRLEEEALTLMDSWVMATSTPTSAGIRAEALQRRISAGCAALASRVDRVLLDGMARATSDLVPVAAHMGGTAIVQSHGDFQPGNVLVEETTRRVFLSDWEYAGPRFRWYDVLTWGLRSRSSPGLADRLAGFMATGRLLGGARGHLAAEASDAGWRRAAMALFLLEEFGWILDDLESGTRAKPAESAAVILAAARLLK